MTIESPLKPTLTEQPPPRLFIVLRCLLPFSYAQYTRFTGAREIILHAFFDWLPAFLILIVVGHESVGAAAVSFFPGYLAFISIYECGYLANDALAVRFETAPRRRLPGVGVGAIIPWVSLRLAVFAAVTVLLHMQRSPRWYGFYAILIVAFAVHNALRLPGLRSVSFVGLAFLRFFGPIFAFITAEGLRLLAPSILIAYVLYRLLGYMESKDLLTIPQRKTPAFRAGFYLVTVPLAVLLSLLFRSWIPAAVHGYYLALGVASWAAERSIKSRASAAPGLPGTA